MFGNFVHSFKAAYIASVQDLISLPAVINNSYGLHQPLTAAAPVTRNSVHMQGIQAERTVIPITSVGQRQDLLPAMSADKSAIFLFPAHTEPS